jgi:hypothetical protein
VSIDRSYQQALYPPLPKPFRQQAHPQCRGATPHVLLTCFRVGPGHVNRRMSAFRFRAHSLRVCLTDTVTIRSGATSSLHRSDGVWGNTSRNSSSYPICEVFGYISCRAKVITGRADGRRLHMRRIVGYARVFWKDLLSWSKAHVDEDEHDHSSVFLWNALRYCTRLLFFYRYWQQYAQPS